MHHEADLYCAIRGACRQAPAIVVKLDIVDLQMKNGVQHRGLEYHCRPAIMMQTAWTHLFDMATLKENRL